MYEKIIRNNLYKKMEKEFLEYKEFLKTLSPDEIIDNSYQYAVKEELYSMFYPESEEFIIDEIKILNKSKSPLEELYNGWMDCDLGINTVLKDSVDSTIENLSLEKNKDRER